MLQKLSKVGIVVLAAGKGTRMKSDKLKVMHDLKGAPLIDHVIRCVEALKLDQKPVVVVCADNPAVQNYLGDRAEYVIQREQLGTGHAVQVAEEKINGFAEDVVVMYGDMPFVSPESIRKLVEKHREKNNVLTLMTVTVDDFEDWRAQFYDFGRIKRHSETGHIIGIVEKKDSSPEELVIKEVNTAFFCFNAEWLWKNLRELKNENAQKEYYLTDLVKLAFSRGDKISSVTIDPHEALGINTKEHLDLAENLRVTNIL